MAQPEKGAAGTAHFEPGGVDFLDHPLRRKFQPSARKGGFSMTISNTAFYTLSFGMLLLLGALLWASGPDLMLALFADL